MNINVMVVGKGILAIAMGQIAQKAVSTIRGEGQEYLEPMKIVDNLSDQFYIDSKNRIIEKKTEISYGIVAFTKKFPGVIVDSHTNKPLTIEEVNAEVAKQNDFSSYFSPSYLVGLIITPVVYFASFTQIFIGATLFSFVAAGYDVVGSYQDQQKLKPSGDVVGSYQDQQELKALGDDNNQTDDLQ